MTWDEWMLIHPPLRVIKKPIVSDDCGPFANYMDALQRQDYREQVDDIAYEVVKHDNDHFVIPKE